MSTTLRDDLDADNNVEFTEETSSDPTFMDDVRASLAKFGLGYSHREAEAPGAEPETREDASASSTFFGDLLATGQRLGFTWPTSSDSAKAPREPRTLGMLDVVIGFCVFTLIAILATTAVSQYADRRERAGSGSNAGQVDEETIAGLKERYEFSSITTKSAKAEHDGYTYDFAIVDGIDTQCTILDPHDAPMFQCFGDWKPKKKATTTDSFAP